MALTLSHFRFGIDSGTESTHGWHAAEDTNPAVGVIALDTTFLLRFCVQANATGLSNVDNEFQYRVNGGTWTNITTTSSNVRAVAATALTNGGNCTRRLSGTGTFESTGAGQTEDGTSGGSANDIVASGNSETECGLQLRSADLTAGGELIEFRLTRDGGVLLDTYAVTPALTMPLSTITATVSRTLDDATLASSADVSVTAIAARTLDDATLDATADVPVTCTLTCTLDDATLDAAAEGESEITCTVSRTLDAATLASTVSSSIACVVSRTTDDATLVAAATPSVLASASRVLDAATCIASATSSVSGSMSRTLDAATCASVATSSIAASVVRTLADAALDATAYASQGTPDTNHATMGIMSRSHGRSRGRWG